MEQRAKKKLSRIYVKVTSVFDATGYMQPNAIIWSDGRTFPIEEIRDFHPADDINGDCYTVVIKGQEKHLFFERTDPRFTNRLGRWFVEGTTLV